MGEYLQCIVVIVLCYILLNACLFIMNQLGMMFFDRAHAVIFTANAFYKILMVICDDCLSFKYITQSFKKKKFFTSAL